MPETYKGPTQKVGDKDSIQALNRPSGTQQQQPLPNENLQNQPYSSTKTMDREKQQQQWNDTDPDEGVSEGVTQGHASPQQAKHGHGAEGSSSTGLPQGEDSRNPSSDHNPRTKEAHGGEAHARDVTNQSHTGSTSQRRS
jgi:hypothetical protein